MIIHLELNGRTAAADTQGGELTSCRGRDGVERIWQGDPAVWPGRNPILFPIVGALEGGAARIGGREYPMGRHGFARNSSFTLAEREPHRAVLVLTHSPETLARYPFPFRLAVEHQLTESGFATSFRVENPGPETLPFCIGGHTGFRCPAYGGERFEDYEIAFDEEENLPFLHPDGQGLLDMGDPRPWLLGQRAFPLTREPFDQYDTMVFLGLRSRGVSLRRRDGVRGLRMEFSDFPLLALWTKPGANAPFLCVEPWHGHADAVGEGGRLEDKPFCILLGPGQTRTLGYSVSFWEQGE